MTEDLSTVRSYRTGGWFGIFGEHASVLLPPSEKARVAALWELVDAGSDFNELLDALITSGLRGLPGFVLISSGDEPTRVVLRGAARASFTLAGGETVEVDGGEAATWVEKILHAVTAVEVHLEDEGGADDYVLQNGLVRVSRVDVPPYAGPAAEPVAASSSEPVTGPAPAPMSEAPDASGDVAFAAAPVVVPLGEISDAESERESPAPAPVEEVEEVEPADPVGVEPFSAYAEGEGTEEPAAVEPADVPTEQFDPMQHDAGDYDPAPAGPFAVHAEGQATEEPAAEEPAGEEPEEEEESHWPFSDPDATGEQPAVEEPAVEEPPSKPPDPPPSSRPSNPTPGRRRCRGASPRATSTSRRRHPATPLPPRVRRRCRRPRRRCRRPRRRTTTTTATPSPGAGTRTSSPGSSRASPVSRRHRASPPMRSPDWCSPTARPSTSTGRC